MFVTVDVGPPVMNADVDCACKMRAQVSWTATCIIPGDTVRRLCSQTLLEIFGHVMPVKDTTFTKLLAYGKRETSDSSSISRLAEETIPGSNGV